MRTLSLRSIFVSAMLATACAQPPQARLPAAEMSAPALEPITQIDGFLREIRILAIALPNGSSTRVEVMITRPDQPGRYPLVVLNHGSPRDPADRVKTTPTRWSAQAMSFARRGYAVLSIVRRGYGQLRDDWAEAAGPCTNRNYVRGGRVSAQDIVGAVRVIQQEPWVDPARVLLLGQSAGGFGALAAASENVPGVVGVISFAGGRGSDAPDHVCQSDRLTAALHQYASTTRVPSVWIYAENDHFFGPTLAREMFDAYVSGGAHAELEMVPPFGEDGHMLFSRGAEDEWWPRIQSFLSALHLPVDIVYPKPELSLPAPPHATKSGQEGFARYVASEGFEKAFAIGTSSWGSASGERSIANAIAVALEHCSAHGSGCEIYAVGNSLTKPGP